MKSLHCWAIVCLFLCVALPAVGQDWVQKQVIIVPNNAKVASYGQNMAVDGNNMAVTHTLPSINSNDGPLYPGGNVYFYEKINDNWTYIQTINYPNPNYLPHHDVRLSVNIAGEYTVVCLNPKRVYILDIFPIKILYI